MAINQHKQMAMTGKCGCETKMKKGGLTKKPAEKMNCGGMMKKKAGGKVCK